DLAKRLANTVWAHPVNPPHGNRPPLTTPIQPPPPKKFRCCPFYFLDRPNGSSKIRDYERPLIERSFSLERIPGSSFGVVVTESSHGKIQVLASIACLHADRTTGSHRHHRHPYRLAGAGGAEGARGGA